jgi:hypothetical protein
VMARTLIGAYHGHLFADPGLAGTAALPIARAHGGKKVAAF